MSRTLVCAALVGVACLGCNRTAAQTKNEAVPAAEITVVGCVQPSDQTATNAAGQKDTTYMLTNAKSGKKNADAPTGTAGSTSPSPPNATTYRLNASDATLSPEVGHQVEIIAVVEDPGAAPATAPKLKVEKVRMIAVPCPK
jgi:hypothetical protein